MDFHTVGNVRRLQKTLRGAVDKIGRVRRKRRIIARQLNSNAALFENQTIRQRNWMKKRFEFVKAVGAFAQDVEEEINFAGRKAFEGRALKRKAPNPRTGWRFW